MNLPRLLAVLGYFAILTTCGPAALAAPTEMQATAADVGDRGGAGQRSEGGQAYSPYTTRSYADRVFFGDIHFHTDLSFDAGLIGTTLDAHAGYRMARGEKVISNTGPAVRLIRPLDFLAITDHAEMIGLAPAIAESSPILLSEPWGKWMHERFNAGQEGRMEAVRDVVDKGTSGVNPFSSDKMSRSIWDETIEIAEQYNEPGRFTTTGRLRVDVHAERRQPPSRRHLPRWRRQDQPDAAVQPVRQHGSRRSLEVPGLL